MSDAARKITTDDGMEGVLDDAGRLVIPQPDGGVIYRVNWREKTTESTQHTANLATAQSETAL